MRRLPAMDGRVCLVTGGNSGIGEATAQGLAALGAEVIIASRTEARGQAAVERLREATGRRVELVVGDLSSVAGADALADAVLQRFPDLHVLVNNAGLFVDRRQESPDGLEMTFAVNHLGPFVLTTRLLDRLEHSGTARVVNVSSGLYPKGALDFDDLQMTRGRFDGMKAYSRSKMCNVLFTRELARRAQARGITANCLHPGVIKSGLGSRAEGLSRYFFSLAQPFLASPEKGARTPLYLAASHDVADQRGHYFDKCKRKKLTRWARKDAHAERLWLLTEGLVRRARESAPPRG